ncbi:GNAT family N-acetyltransferase [Desulfoferrobacter suflitae]|uniref:GNAT family N-acetyltransferase n=1 Tax=Desulfoferrobacter suflitae TaxID=2865782 RepID=UPI00216401DC|nr:GNAT family N-acetyltransferase [Desulfoferrobacter suflitae]MCK8601701.1 GNAT family N-acetyltransferase [Desulfoferrobacter suflitae]
MEIRIIDNLDGKVETINDSDAEQVAQLIRGNTKAYNQGEYTEEQLERLCAFATPENLKEEIDRGFLVMLRTDEGELIGCAIIMKRGTRRFIRTIQVSQEHARKGYGAMLYQHCEERYRKAGIAEIEVEVTKFKSTESFYRKQGFVKTGNPTQNDLYFAMYKFL